MTFLGAYYQRSLTPPWFLAGKSWSNPELMAGSMLLGGRIPPPNSYVENVLQISVNLKMNQACDPMSFEFEGSSQSPGGELIQGYWLLTNKGNVRSVAGDIFIIHEASRVELFMNCSGSQRSVNTAWYGMQGNPEQNHQLWDIWKGSFPSSSETNKTHIWKSWMINCSSNEHKCILVNSILKKYSTKSSNSWGHFPSFQTCYFPSFITDSSLTLSAFARSFCTRRSLQVWLPALASVHLRPNRWPGTNFTNSETAPNQIDVV